MYKVLVVDDERIIREGIAAIVKWEKHGFFFMGAAQNGVEAYKMILKDSPHIVITDIKMPVLDGLQLIAKVKAELPETVFIVLSGYGEFELAKEAMRYGVRYYLLKPCNENKIIEVLNEIKAEFIHKEQQEELVKKSRTNFEVIPQSKEQNYSKLVRTMIHYIRDNIANEDFSLKWLAHELMYMNVDYLSKIFVKETGEKFSHFVTRLRMEKAKEFIAKSDDDRVCEVAQKVGLGNNPQYFSQLFKKYTGFAPSEYKRGS